MLPTKATYSQKVNCSPWWQQKQYRKLCDLEVWLMVSPYINNRNYNGKIHLLKTRCTIKLNVSNTNSIWSSRLTRTRDKKRTAHYRQDGAKL